MERFDRCLTTGRPRVSISEIPLALRLTMARWCSGTVWIHSKELVSILNSIRRGWVGLGVYRVIGASVLMLLLLGVVGVAVHGTLSGCGVGRREEKRASSKTRQDWQRQTRSTRQVEPKRPCLDAISRSCDASRHVTPPSLSGDSRSCSCLWANCKLW